MESSGAQLETGRPSRSWVVAAWVYQWAVTNSAENPLVTHQQVMH
jgi:hypothetical protein